MSEKEPEVVHLEWERVQDPTREPPPELVVAEPEPEERSSPVRDYLNKPNPISQPGNEVVTFIVYAVIVTIWAVVMVLLRGG
ncbi:MAG: hypothetical protein IM666_10370 [Phenylobacterium sp.]|uniref:hypothetical protein n=1 Tax=Phenylobacterium sp. TaxID=1871053 RepID=UPI0025ED1BD2|nr:hypothetical protein [Phenylobacterium sp.]MCA3732943.1 hypothetical protein [Phenylobacterium sp.]MCA3750582.1 hypothetical protein [Phenylobacterium sp.]MCA6237287.1 hypothetical protein [Phenylobacterium sp.]MCA6244155.1 hypothetical protein [Phenylobacterium sp.]